MADQYGDWWRWSRAVPSTASGLLSSPLSPTAYSIQWLGYDSGRSTFLPFCVSRSLATLHPPDSPPTSVCNPLRGGGGKYLTPHRSDRSDHIKRLPHNGSCFIMSFGEELGLQIDYCPTDPFLLLCSGENVRECLVTAPFRTHLSFLRCARVPDYSGNFSYIYRI